MKNIKLIITLLSIILVVESVKSSPIEKMEKNSVLNLSVKGTYLVNSLGDTITLRGVSYGWHNFWPRFYNASSAKYIIKNWKANLLRASMGVDIDRNSYISKPEFGEKCVTAIVDAAINNGAYVIIDWHCHNLKLKEAKKFFTKMAIRYKGVPNVIYEIYNEPINDSWKD